MDQPQVLSLTPAVTSAQHFAREIGRDSFRETGGPSDRVRTTALLADSAVSRQRHESCLPVGDAQAQ